MALSKERKAEIVKAYGKNEKDTGSVEVQVALLTEQIKALTEHAASKRGLMILVGQRRSLLDYLARTDREAYLKLIVSLGLRK